MGNCAISAARVPCSECPCASRSIPPFGGETLEAICRLCTETPLVCMKDLLLPGRYRGVGYNGKQHFTFPFVEGFCPGALGLSRKLFQPDRRVTKEERGKRRCRRETKGFVRFCPGSDFAKETCGQALSKHRNWAGLGPSPCFTLTPRLVPVRLVRLLGNLHLPLPGQSCDLVPSL